jgi:DNA (cytosine-5)-methyltransferase 1
MTALTATAVNTAVVDPTDGWRVTVDHSTLPALDPTLTRPRPSTGLVGMDFFAGFGGSSTGLFYAGVDVALAVNHWLTGIRTHAANHRQADHWQSDLGRWRDNDPLWRKKNTSISRFDGDLYGWLPRVDLFWASPSCSAHTNAQGKKRDDNGQADMWEDGEEPEDESAERSRGTMRDVLRALDSADMRGQPILAGIVENVAEVVTRWKHWNRWAKELEDLDYEFRIVSLNAAFAADDSLDIARAPQLRDRIFIVYWRRELPGQPDLDIRATSWCPGCETLVEAAQVWKRVWRTTPVGKYGRSGQYWYRCPTCRAVAEPLVQPAADVIDWSDTGPLIGDRAALGLKPLVKATRERVAAGLARFGTDPALIATGGSWNNDPASPGRPFRTRTATEWEAIATSRSGVTPFLVRLRGGGEKGRAHSPWAPLGTFSAQGEHHALVATGQRHMITSYYGNGGCSPTLVPLPTQSTRDRFALVSSDSPRVDACTYRMLDPDREIKRAMAFPPGYIGIGTRGDLTRGYGNAVAPNCAAIVADRLVRFLLGERRRPLRASA